MQYLLMCCFNETRWEALPEAQRAKVMAEYGAFTENIAKSGHLRGGGKLGPISTATTLREKDGKPITIDGPFAETKEHLGGYHLIECKDLDEALSIARRIPTLPVGGSVEVRPVELSEG